MAVIGVAHERIESRNSRHFGDNEREYTRQFWVQLASYSDDPALAINAVGIPKRLQAYCTASHTDLWSWCDTISAERNRDNPKVVEVECHYTTVEINIDLSGNMDSPLLERPEIEFGFESKQKALYGYPDPQQAYQGGGKPTTSSGITNSAGEPFDPPVEIEVSYPVLTITRNEPTFFPNLAVQFQDAVNSDNFWGVNPHCARVKAIRGTKQYGKGQNYWKVTYTIAFNRETWDLQILDIGTYYIDASDGNLKKKFYTDVPDKQPKVGNLTAVGDDGGATIHFKTFSKIYREEVFALLNLPQVGEIND